MAVVGYVRVSTADQSTARQDLGDDVDKVFTDHASGKDTDRPALREAMAYVRDCDTFRVHSADRLARSLVDLVNTVDGLVKRGVRVELLKECLTFDPCADEADHFAMFQLQVLGAFAQLERALIKQRQREGIAAAKERGVYASHGRAPALTVPQVRDARTRRAMGVPVARLAKDHGVSKVTMTEALAGRGVYGRDAYADAGEVTSGGAT